MPVGISVMPSDSCEIGIHGVSKEDMEKHRIPHANSYENFDTYRVTFGRVEVTFYVGKPWEGE